MQKGNKTYLFQKASFLSRGTIFCSGVTVVDGRFVDTISNIDISGSSHR